MSETLQPEVAPYLNAVLIGGGEAYRYGKNLDTEGGFLDLSIAMTGSEHPHALLIHSARSKAIPTVTGRLEAYYNSRGATFDVLHPFFYVTDEEGRATPDGKLNPETTPSPAELAERIEAANVIFVLGGDTNRMLNMAWRPLGIDTLLREAAQRGTVMTGVSAGTIAWFEGGHTDGDTLTPPGAQPKFHYIQALGLISRTVVCPHYDATPKNEPNRKREPSFDSMMYRRREKEELGVGIDNLAAIQITTGGLVRALQHKGEGRRHVHTISYASGKKHKSIVTPADGYVHLGELVE